MFAACSVNNFAHFLPYVAVNHRRPSLSGRRSSCLKHSAATCHVYIIADCILQSPEDTPLQMLLPLLCLKSVIFIVGHTNRSFYLVCLLLK